MAGSANNKATDGIRQRKEVYGENRRKRKRKKVEEI